MYFISDFCQQMINQCFLLYSSIRVPLPRLIHRPVKPNIASSFHQRGYRLWFLLPSLKLSTSWTKQMHHFSVEEEASAPRGVRWPLVSLLGGICGQSVRVQMRPRRCLRSTCKYLQKQRVVNMHLTPDECDLLIFSLVWTCHRRLIPRFCKSFETVKQKRALFPVVDQYIANTAGCVWQTNYQTAIRICM